MVIFVYDILLTVIVEKYEDTAVRDSHVQTVIKGKSKYPILLHT
jgi:hypothetical protein